MKNIKMSTRISLVVVLAIVIGLSCLAFIVSSRTNSSMSNATEMRMMEATDSRTQLFIDYLEKVDLYLAGLAETNALQDYVADPSNVNAYQAAQDFVDSYATLLPNVEGLFACDYQSVQLVHSIHDAVGARGTADDEALKQVQGIVDNMWASGEGYLRGVMASPSTGAVVIVYYYPLYDTQGNGVGYVGAGINASGIIDVLNSMEFHGWDNAYMMLLSADSSSYIWAPDETLIGSAIEDENLLGIISAASAEETSGSASADAVHPQSTEYYDRAVGGQVLTTYEYLPGTGVVVVVSDKKSEIFADTKTLNTMVVVISIIVALVVAVLTVIVVRLSVKGLVSVGHTISEIAESMDMTKSSKLRSYANQKDEVGAMAKATLALTDAVTSAVRALQEHGHELASASDNLAEISDQTLQNVNQVEVAVHDIAEGATSQANETENASGAVVEIGNQIQDAATATASIMVTSENMQKASLEVTDVIDKLVAIGEQTSQAMNEIYEQTNTTNESAMKIKSATEIITSIAEETNLLSLNASIEAARAGEQGKGFAVVASQIQKLAEQSSSSAQQIDAVIAALIADSQQSVDTMERVRKVMDEQSELVRNTGEIFQDVKDGISRALDGLNEISRRTHDMDGARQSVVDVVENLSAIAEENAAGTEETSASVTIVNDLMADISETATNVSRIADDMDKELSIFKISEDQVSSAEGQEE